MKSKTYERRASFVLPRNLVRLSVTKRAILRRVLAAAVLTTFAVGSVLFWNRGVVDPIQLGLNLLLATLGMLWLHVRWRRREKRELTPSKVKDIFS